ncbi:unnamed protein product [Adineta steineri]|uniref:Cullin N-terminal domain-containing protein n=1 Tax=Adineta steineri TaxID=433720 RepID=A0A818NTR2_9BILA|nr:unnamed protein product [Adineta steineri]
MTEIHGQAANDECWIDIKRGIDSIYQLQAMPAATYMQLSNRVPGAIEKLKEIVEKHIYLTGLQVIESIAETALTDAKVYITKIIKIYNKYLFLIHECFGGERSSFIGVLDSACSKFINKNAITEASGISTEACGASIKSAELLARYSDIVLKTRNVTNDADMVKLLKEIMIKCGLIYTSKFQKMIEDMDAQESLLKQYQQYCVENQLRNTSMRK